MTSTSTATIIRARVVELPALDISLTGELSTSEKKDKWGLNT